ncbi:unnamed protein product [Rotaria sp. Silwood2]|nr:unnamed protein product [Rotaria sp. Silwood2]CAF2526909.1 unnamed protein product [Rotaria sp. Silwood2]CAF2758078.1 unnamed protein product [Rotaria sp. Silwood2]CAF2936366.1 unnamed protein product [Rotaria sp. Silwood2]CAF4027858.1 unnamed protein product [Rotaria sp. Silwood2]
MFVGWFILKANTHPTIKWGQKKDHILLTIAVQDIDKPEINIEPTKLHFKGQQTKGLSYDTILEFFEEIDPKTSKYRKTSQNYWELMLKKKDSTKPFWKRLTKSAEKCSWIVVDWNHFTAEGDDEDEMDGTGGKDWGDLDGMFKQMGGGLDGTSAPDLNDLDEEGTDSDDEPMPDLEDVPKTDDEKAKSNVTNEQTK